MTKTLYAEFVVKPGNEARVKEMMLDLTARVRDEPGNISFVAYTRAENPRAYFVFEIYADEAAFQEHISAPYGTVFNVELNSLIEGTGSELSWLEPLEDS